MLDCGVAALIARFAYCAAIGAFIWLVHKAGAYSEPLPRSASPGREIRDALLLWAVGVAVPLLRMYVAAPWLGRLVPDPFLLELAWLPLLTVPYVALPLYLVRTRDRWTATDLGLTLRVCAPVTAVLAVCFGLLSGAVAFATRQAVIGFGPLPTGVLLLRLYNNDFIEEFFHRGVIQSKLERAIGRHRAVLLGGVLFGLTHVAFDISRLASTQGWLFVAFALLLQIMAGWLLGLVYVKTRSLWPGTVCHYLANWLPAILAGLAG